MAQPPKGGLVRRHDKPIHGSCAIYFPGGVSHLGKGKSSSKVPWEGICWFPGGSLVYLWVIFHGNRTIHRNPRMVIEDQGSCPMTLDSRKVPRCLCEGKPFIFEIVECLQGGPLLVIKGVNNPHEWPYKWVTGDITPISRVISFDPTYNW